MSARESNLDDESRRDEKAAEWLIKRDLGFTAEEQDAFFQWLGQNPAHGDSFARLQKTWTEFDLLSQWMPEHSGEPNPDLLAKGMPRKGGRSWGPYMALAALLVVVFTLWSLFENFGDTPEIKAQYITADDYGYHVLEDGTELDMNHGAEVSIEFSEGVRLVKLLAGEVYFTVAKNAYRPFVVRAGETDVRAVGTAFNVLLGSDSVEVLVTEGKVRVEKSVLSEKRSSNVDSNSVGLVMIPGQRSVLPLELKTAELTASQVDASEIERLLSWKHELLDFDSTPLSEAVTEFNRRNDIQLVIADKSLAELPVVASFRSNNVKGFARLMELTFDVEVERASEQEIVLRRR